MLNFINKKLKVRSLNIAKASLNRTIELLSESEESAYALKKPEAIVFILNETLDKLNEDNIEQVLSEISILFAPTGDIQEISIENGWGKEFLELSTICD